MSCICISVHMDDVDSAGGLGVHIDHMHHIVLQMTVQANRYICLMVHMHMHMIITVVCVCVCVSIDACFQ